MGWIEDIKNAVGQTPVMKGIQGAFNFLDTAPDRPTSLNKKPIMQSGGFQGGGGSFANPGGGFQGGSGSFGMPAANDQNALNKFGFQQQGQFAPTPEGFRFDQDMQSRSQEDMYQSLIDELMGKINRDYAYDGSGDAMVDQAFQGSLDALGNARQRTNDNYSTSRENLDSLTNSHVANIQGADRDAVNRIGSDLTSSYGNIYDSNAKGLEDDRAKEVALKTEMLQRLGIQDAGPGTVGEVQTQAIANNGAEKAGAMQQAEGYKAADLTRNVEQAQSMANAGVERQSDLRRQLDGILGGLDTQEAGIKNDMASAKLSARQADEANFGKQQGYYQDSLETLLNDRSNQAESQRDFDYKMALDVAKQQQGGSNGGSNSMFDVVDGKIASQGLDPAPYRSAFNEAMQEGGGPLASGVGDKNSHIQKRMIEIMRKKGMAANPATIGDYVFGVMNYGTDKLNAG